MPRKTLTTPLKIHGGKHYLAAEIVALFPPRGTYRTYFEGFFGGGSVLLRHNPEGKSEVVCDLNANLTTFWRVLQDESLFKAFHRRVVNTPFSEVEFAKAQEDLKIGFDDTIDLAWAFFVVARQSMSGRNDAFTPVSTNRLRRGMNEQVSAYYTAVDGLPQVAERMRRVLVLNGPAVKQIKKYDKPGVLMYLDPPYLAVDSDGTKIRQSVDVYEHEMTLEQHEDLLETLVELENARVLLSGYKSKLYDKHLEGWNTKVFQIDNKASKKSTKDVKEEIVWMNF
jgi:DNA adenine methylase